MINRIARPAALTIAGVLLYAIASSENSLAFDDAPAWLRQAVQQGTASSSQKVPAVVLLNEQSIKVEEDGRVITTERGAVRILTREGREEAVGSLVYMTDTGKVKEIRAWLIHPSGEVKKYNKDKAADLTAAPNDVYNEVRVKIISASDEAEPGSVFGYEWTVEEKSVFTQFDWQFQERLPTALSRFTISLPAGWRAQGIVFNHPKLEPAVAASSYTWEMRDLPLIDDEPASPPVTNLAPRLAVSYFPAQGARAGQGRAFDNWADVSRWLSELSDTQAQLDDALAGKARMLVASARNELERIRLIGQYVQGVNYISIQTGVGRGGGYRPHAATDVFAKSYGDCKDKANLMRAMLKALNIPSYLVCIYSGDPTYVREEWPSPQQFNHCIIAVKVSDETQAATIIKHPALGRLLIFDPTDDNTPVGDLPDHEQGSLALVIAGEQGALLRMPVTPPEANLLERQTEVVLGPDGSITAKVREHSSGQSGVNERRRFRGRSRPDYVKMVEQWISSGASGANISKLDPVDNSAEGLFTLSVEFSAERYGQLMQNRLLVFKPAIVSRRESLFLTGGARRHPVVLESHAYTEKARIKLPDGFEVDELPDPVKLEASFGSYTTNYEVKDGHLHFTRRLILQPAIIPVSDFARVRSFFERIRGAEQSPVVLARK